MPAVTASAAPKPLGGDNWSCLPALTLKPFLQALLECLLLRTIGIQTPGAQTAVPSCVGV